MNLSKILCCICCLLSTWAVLGSDDTQYEVTFVGDTGVGKTQIINMFVKDELNEKCEPTIGVDFFSKTFVQEKIITMKIWDTSGQEKFKSLIPYYIKDHIVFVYDITNRKSFENITKWMEFVKENSKEGKLYFLVGNKTDLRDNNNEGNQVSQKEGEIFANNNKMIFLGEVSAKERKEIDDLFKDIIIKCLGKFNEITDVKKSDIEVIENDGNDYGFYYNIYNKDTDDNFDSSENEKSCWESCFRSCCSKLTSWKKKKKTVNEDMIKKIGKEEKLETV